VLAGHLSYRRRRRLIVLLALLVVAGGIAAAIVKVPTGTKLDRTSVSHPPPGQYKSETSQAPPRRLSKLERRQLLSSIILFVTASVARKQPERSWPIIDASLRQGLTKQQWSSGNIPVVPFPAIAVGPLRITSVVGKKALVELVLVPGPRSHLVRKTFIMELREQSRQGRRWTVSSWEPEGITYSLASRQPIASAAYHSNTLSPLWILLPVGALIAGVLLLPAGVFFRDAYRARRAEAEARSARS
jgi:hypothetical protein